MNITDIYGKWKDCKIHHMKYRTTRNRKECCLCIAPKHKHIDTTEEYLYQKNQIKN